VSGGVTAQHVVTREAFRSRLAYRRMVGKVAAVLFLLSTLVGIVALAVLLLDVLLDGLPYLSLSFLDNYPSRFPDRAGLRPALFGTLWVAGLTGIMTFPIGTATAIYLEEYAPKNKLTLLIEVNISNLAGVPSIVYGLLGLTVFVTFMQMGRTIIAGALTLTLLVLPMVVVAAREAIKAVPDSYRQGSLALGATKWQTIYHVTLPAAVPGILTGTILAMARAIGEAAPMIAIAALVYLTFTPTHPFERFTVLPIQVFNWISRPQMEWKQVAAAGIIVLLVVLLTMNAAAIILRDKFQKRARE
jgi:phosphate transport system permease protein